MLKCVLWDIQGGVCFVTELARGVYEAIDNFSHISDPDWVIGDGKQAAEMEDEPESEE